MNLISNEKSRKFTVLLLSFYYKSLVGIKAHTWHFLGNLMYCTVPLTFSAGFLVQRSASISEYSQVYRITNPFLFTCPAFRHLYRIPKSQFSDASTQFTCCLNYPLLIVYALSQANPIILITLFLNG